MVFSNVAALLRSLRSPGRRSRANRGIAQRHLPAEVLETRAMLSVNSLNITGISSGSDTDGGIPLNVAVNPGATVTVTFAYSSTSTLSTSAKLDFNTFPTTVSTSETPVTSGGTIATPLTSSLTLQVPAGTQAGSYTAHILMKNGNGNGSTANDSEPSSIDVSIPITVLNSTTINNGVPAVAVYDGNSHGITSVTVSDVNGSIPGALVVTKYFDAGDVELPGAPVSAGSYKVVSTFAGDSTHNASSDTDYFTIARADALIAVSGYTGGTYDGLSHTQTVTVTGISGVLFTDSLTGTNAGPYAKTWSFSSSDYNDASGALSFIISQATPTVVVSGYTGGTYDGTSHSQTVTVTGVPADGQLFTDSLTATNADSYSQNWAFSANPNYLAVSGTLSYTIAQATPTVVVSGYTGGTYDGTSHSQTVTVTGVPADGQLFTDSLTATNAGSYSQNWAFSANPNYTAVSGTLAFDISKAVLTGEATTQAALNVAKNGTLAWTAKINAASIVGGETVASLFNGAIFTLTINGVNYSLTSSANVSEGIVYVNWKVDAGLKDALDNWVTSQNTSASAAAAGNLRISCTTVGGNYTFSDDFLTKLFYSLRG